MSDAQQQNQKQAQEQLQRLLARSATDMEFRAQLLSDPNAALAEFTGGKVPEDHQVVFIENQGDATFVLPDPIDPDAELAESDLQAVAGGVAWTVVFTSIVGTVFLYEQAKDLGDDDVMFG